MTSRPTRRGLLACWAGLGLVGCLGTDEEPPEQARTDWPSHDGTDAETIPHTYDCDGVCGMNPASYPEWHAQLAHDDGTGAFFCSTGCLLSYVAVPDHTGARDADVTGVWVRDVRTVEWTDGMAAHWVLETDTDEQQPGEPMELNPRPFQDPADASAYVDDRDQLAADAIVAFEDLDHEIAHRYRSSRLPAP